MSSIEAAREAAARLDALEHQAANQVTFPSANSFFIALRGYLLVQNERLGQKNDLYSLLKRAEDTKGFSVFTLGPQIDKGDTPEHFHFPSGARLSLGVTLRRSSTCSLVSYRFHLHFPDGASPQFVRFELNGQTHEDPLLEPRCHVHPGIEDARLPLPPLSPFEVLDRVFFTLEQH